LHRWRLGATCAQKKPAGQYYFSVRSWEIPLVPSDLLVGYRSLDRLVLNQVVVAQLGFIEAAGRSGAVFVGCWKMSRKE
jgi:hypothetical protein